MEAYYGSVKVMVCPPLAEDKRRRQDPIRIRKDFAGRPNGGLLG